MSTSLHHDYFTEDELAAELGVCRRTVIRWRNQGDGPPVTKLGRRPIYRRAAVVGWLAAREGKR